MGISGNERSAGPAKRGSQGCPYYFDVATRKFSGNGGCNQVNGNYSLDKNEIRFTEVLSTKMSCSDIEFENTFLSILGSIDKYEIKGNDLFLKKKKEAMLVLRPKQASGPY
jgi:heat shock protein HslJ